MKKYFNKSILSGFLLFCLLFTPIFSVFGGSNSAHVNSVLPQSIVSGDTIVISGSGFGQKKGNVYLGAKKYPYYGTAIESWDEARIVVKTDLGDSLEPGVIHVQPWDLNMNKLGTIVSGPEYTIRPVINKITPTKVAVGSSLSIYGSGFTSNMSALIGGVDLETTYINSRFIEVKISENAKSGTLTIIDKQRPSLSITSSYITIVRTFSDTSSVYDQWYLEAISARDAWKVTRGSTDVIVAVIDDGVYRNHPDLQNNMWINQDEVEGNNVDDDGNGYTDDRWGWDFVFNSYDMTTVGSHGTMVAGVIASSGKELTGIAPNVRIMPLIVSDPYSGISEYDIERAIHYAVDNGANIINLSLGSQPYHFTTFFDDAIQYAFDHNVLVVVSAGNGDTEGGRGSDLSAVKVSPVCNDGSSNWVLGVGSTTRSDTKTSWSNYGPCVDVYAPGEEITSASVPRFNDAGALYETASGTSFSAPIVTGIAALLKSHYPFLSAQALRDTIIQSSSEKDGIHIVDAGKALVSTIKKQTEVSGQKDRTAADSTSLLPTIYTSFIEDEKSKITTRDHTLESRLSGVILLQVESQGQAWYVFPDNKKRYYLGKPEDALQIMKKLGLGASHQFISSHTIFPDHVLGKILIDVESHGEAYYINPENKRAYFLGRPDDALHIMTEVGLGISNDNIRKLGIGEL